MQHFFSAMIDQALNCVLSIEYKARVSGSHSYILHESARATVH